MLAFLKDYEGAENVDFLYGYCTHILADIENNIKIWTPFRLTNSYAFENGGMSDYHSESRKVDHALYMLHPQKDEIKLLLEKATCYDIPGVALAVDMDRMRRSLVHDQYVDKEIEDLTTNRFITLDGIRSFISEEAKYVAGILFGDE